MAAALLKGFDINGWFSAIVGAIVLSIVNYLLYILIGNAHPTPGANI